MNTRRVTTTAAGAGFLACILAANYAIAHIGAQPDPKGPHVLPVWPGIDAPSGVYVVGLTLVLRDVVQRLSGKAVTVALILLGAALTWFISPAFAIASAVAFLASEFVDFGVFSVAQSRVGDLWAVALSNAASVVVDSVLFLALAFGSLAFLPGQVIGKAWATLAAIAVLAALKSARTNRKAVTA